MRLVLVLAVSLSGLPVCAAGAAKSDVTVTQPWARATPGASTNGAAYMTITATGTADRLVGFSTPVADTAGLHQSASDQGVMLMRAVGPLPLEPGKSVTLAPGSYHVMLMDLRRALKQGDRFPLTLTFEHASPVTVQVDVARVGARAPTESDADHAASRENMTGHQR